MPLRPFTSQCIQNYPKIQIDRGSVIKPCVTDQAAVDQFIDKPASSWTKLIHDIWHEGIPFVLKYVSTLKIPTNSNIYYTYLLRSIKYLAVLMLHIHSIYLYIYGYFYPYSLKSYDEVCDEFSRCPKWTEAVIRAFAWHPDHERCAVAICNDYIYVYQSATRIRVLRHNHQRKIVDMAWQPKNKEILAVATQTSVILWRIADHHNNSVKNSSMNSNYAYLAPGVHLIRRATESSTNGEVKHEVANGCSDNNSTNSHMNDQCFKILKGILPGPIVSLQFDRDGHKLYACSPNSSRIAVIDMNRIFLSDGTPMSGGKQIDYLTRFGQGITKLIFSPTKDRLVTATTSSFIRVFEPFRWTFGKWQTQGITQDIIWSRPAGRMLLMANKHEPCLYALPFLDSPQANDVGGNKSLMKVLDLTATQSEVGNMVGGLVQSFAWDKEGRRLAISFKDNPESILLYRTIERPTLEFHPMGIIQSENSSTPLLMEFHDKFKNGSLLTICWSDGHCQHIPLCFQQSEFARNNLSRDDRHDKSHGPPNNSYRDISSPPKTPRSLTNFCHVSGNNSISSNPSSLTPINKLQHQTTLFSLPKSQSFAQDSLECQDSLN